MAKNYTSFDQLSQDEYETMTRNREAYPRHYAFANNAVSLLNNAVAGYPESHAVFGLYWGQISVCCALAILSTLRQHRTQAYAMLRHGLEHACLAAYALAKPEDEYFRKDRTEADHEGFLKRKVYSWIKGTYPNNSDEIERIKKLINEDHAHASIVHAHRNLSVLGELSVSLDFFDKVTPETMQADLIHVAYICLLTLDLFREVNANARAIRVKAGVDQEYMAVYELGFSLIPGN